MILIVGGSRGFGKSLARVFSQDNITLVLSRSEIEDKNINLTHIQKDINQLNFEELLKKIPHKSLEAIFFTIGIVDRNDDISLDEKKARNILETNYFSITRLTESLINNKKLKNNSLICYCSSVTTIIPRAKQINYCAAKTALNSYCESLSSYIYQNKINIRVSNLVLGYLDTNMGGGKKTPFKKINTIYLANKIKRKYKSMRGKYYIPYYWNLIAIFSSIIPKIVINYLLRITKI